jgi:DNA polymerase I-like protein with 3'-5' exonuclease and polymerase domains
LSRESRPESDKLSRILEAASDVIAELWDSLASRLKLQGEYERLTTVEWPLQSAFAYRQFRGIRIDTPVADELLGRISAEKYAAYRQVAEHLNKSPTGLSYWNVQQHLAGTDVAYLKDLDPGGRLQSAFELAAVASPFANSFVSLMKAGRDASIVRRALGGAERLYPIFHVMGTVSGRILVSDPYLQQLRRAYRSLIAAEPHNRLIYLDYAQFEPGVLAGLSGDAQLIAAYNDGDLYAALAHVLFGDTNQRPTAKRVFLAFSYGMTPDRIAVMLAGGGTESERIGYAEKIEAFFATYSDLARFRISQQDALRENGYVSSLFGNRRMRTTTGEHLSLKEQRWALNQPVQSTASLIFKEALTAIIAEFGIEQVILPVHDAVLLQFPDDEDFQRRTQRAIEIMVGSFTRRIPGVRARIKAGLFTE